MTKEIDIELLDNLIRAAEFVSRRTATNAESMAGRDPDAAPWLICVDQVLAPPLARLRAFYDECGRAWPAGEPNGLDRKLLSKWLTLVSKIRQDEPEITAI